MTDNSKDYITIKIYRPVGLKLKKFVSKRKYSIVGYVSREMEKAMKAEIAIEKDNLNSKP